VIHRDVKPSNIVLAPDPENGEEPKLIDFGLAKFAAIAPEDQLTRNGQIVGTPHYMAPEPIANQDVDARTDVYALGCVLFQMLTGAPPFKGETDVNLLYQHLQNPAPTLRERAPELPVGFGPILERALAKAPAHRFQSMSEMANAIEETVRPATLRATDRELVVASPPSPRRFFRPSTFFPVSAMLLLVASAAGYLISHENRNQGLIFVSSTPTHASVNIDLLRLEKRVRGSKPEEGRFALTSSSSSRPTETSRG
jgi:serine/threonine protein kinase